MIVVVVERQARIAQNIGYGTALTLQVGVFLVEVFSTMSSQEFTNSPNELGKTVIQGCALLPREGGSFFKTALDLAADDSSSSSQSLCSFASNLPSESLSPILCANHEMLDVSCASRLPYAG